MNFFQNLVARFFSTDNPIDSAKIEDNYITSMQKEFHKKLTELLDDYQNCKKIYIIVYHVFSRKCRIYVHTDTENLALHLAQDRARYSRNIVIKICKNRDELIKFRDSLKAKAQ